MFVGLKALLVPWWLVGYKRWHEPCEKKDAEEIISIEDSIVKTRLYLSQL
jgi:hypothetical protein